MRFDISCPNLAVITILACLSLLSSCATPIQDVPRTTQWSCDPQADQAVEDGNWDKARLLHEHFLHKQPANCLTQYHLGYILGKFGDRLQEIDFYNQALNCGYKQDVQLFFNLAMAYADSGQTDLALSVFQRGAEIDPEHADIQFGTGVTAMEAGRPVLAEKALGRAVSLDSRYWQARLALARLYLDQNRWHEAQKQIEQVQTDDPENEPAHELMQILEDRTARIY